GVSLNYATPPPPFALPAQPYLPQGPSSTPVSMQNQFMCFYLYLCYFYSIYVFLFAESVVERIERPSSGPELAGGPMAILSCHTRFMKANRMHLICPPGSVYTHMIDHKVNITTSASVKRVLKTLLQNRMC